MQLILYLKAFHIIFIVTWFSGLFFMGRMFVYHAEALKKEAEEKRVLVNLFVGAERRVWFIIVIPSMLLTLTFGSWLMVETGAYREGWFHFKLLFIHLFVAYNFHCGKIRKRLIKETLTTSPRKLRFLNEIPLAFLVAIVFTVFLKSFF